MLDLDSAALKPAESMVTDRHAGASQVLGPTLPVADAEHNMARAIEDPLEPASPQFVVVEQEDPGPQATSAGGSAT